MLIKEIQEFQQIRYKARAYMCYLFNRNIPNNLPGVSAELIHSGFEKIVHENMNFEALYILDSNGFQVENNISLIDKNRVGKGENRTNRSYYYRAVREKRCVLTDPYPSKLTNELCVTAGYPIYDDKGELKFVACVDIGLYALLNMISPSSVDSTFGSISKMIYAIFSLALLFVTTCLFYIGISKILVSNFEQIDISRIFELTIILTLALAIFDLIKAIFEEEVLGNGSGKDSSGTSKTMIRFIASIIIALAIEALMLVFKFSITKPENIVYAVYLICAVGILIISLSIYLWTLKNGKKW